jgi:phage tail sheath protein FI
MAGFWKKFTHRERPGGPEKEPLAGRTIEGVGTSITALIGGARDGPVNRPTLIHSFGEFDRIFGGLWERSPLSFAVHQYYLNGGRDALIIRVNASEDARISDADLMGNRENQSGIHALDGGSTFNLLCLPPPVSGLDVTPATWATAADYCRGRRAFLLVDPPAAVRDPAAVSSWVAGLPAMAGENAAVFFPRVRATNPLNGGRLGELAPGGAVAGVFARSDAARGVWKAAAGPEADLKGVPELAYSLNDAENDRLNQRGINSLRALPEGGPVIWGSRTLAAADGTSGDWQYIPVRRLALYIEASLYRGTEWAVFEANDERLWAALRTSVEGFMQDLFRRGAFQGSAADEAYFVRCDSRTTTPGDVEAGLVNIEVGFAPLKPAEFVVVKVQQRAGRRR